MHCIFDLKTIINKSNQKHENTNFYKYMIHKRKKVKHENTHTI